LCRHASLPVREYTLDTRDVAYRERYLLSTG
jgi:hypothetical protein